jgi:transposase InsO family protein
MSDKRIKMGVGSRLVYDGDLVEVVEMRTAAVGILVVLKTIGDGRVFSAALAEVMNSHRVRALERQEDEAEIPADVAATILSAVSASERRRATERAAHVREVLTGYRAGSAELASGSEPRAEFHPNKPLTARYQAKADELGLSIRTIKQWVADFRSHGEAGLVNRRTFRARPLPGLDERWMAVALEVMVEHTLESRPSRTMVINRTNARVHARFGPDAVRIPSRANAFRALTHLEKRHPTFRLSTKRNRDIAERPTGPYGKLRPTRPGEYVLMDTTRLDVFAMDPLTLRWIQVELTVAMDWYTRCIVGLRLTPVSTKAVDAALVLYETFRPKLAPASWPRDAVWPEHGIPRSVLIDPDAIEKHGASGPAIVPETIVIDHGKIYVSLHLTSVCQRMGISIQPARIRTGRDKGPVERFFRRIREDLLQALPGYKGPDLFSRGNRPEDEAYFFLDELENIIREWIATSYHCVPHGGLLDPNLDEVEFSPRVMLEHGIARAGYIEVPRDPDLAYEFLATEWRTIQHYGVEIRGRRYNGAALNPYRNMESPYTGKAQGRWPIHHDPDDVSRVYFRDPDTREWHVLMWEHAAAMDMPLSEDGLLFARKLAAQKYKHPDDKVAVADLFERWNLGLGKSLAERRMMLRLAREAELPGIAEADTVSSLPSVAHIFNASPEHQDSWVEDQDTALYGDDDNDDDDDGDDDFYANALVVV